MKISMEKRKFYEECCESGKFDDSQIDEILLGINDGLSLKQISMFAKPEFDIYQMIEIKKGLQEFLTEQVALYADPRFCLEQMWQIRLGIEQGLTMEQVKLYANPEYRDDQMQFVRNGLLDGLSTEDIKKRYQDLQNKMDELDELVKNL